MNDLDLDLNPEEEIMFSFDEMMNIKRQEEYFISSINLSECYDGIMYYTDKDELLRFFPTHSLDCIVTDNPTVHNLNILDECLNSRSTIIVYDIALILSSGDFDTNKSLTFFRRKGYELYKQGVINTVCIYEFRRNETKKYTDMCIKELDVEAISMIVSASFDSETTVLIDTYLLPDLIYHCQRNGKSIITIIEFKEVNVNYINRYMESKDDSANIKVEPKTGQYSIAF